MPPAYLTIDDAPSETLPEKIAVLEEHDVPAVFFCEGRRLAEFPTHARQAVTSGFHLGNHTYAHRRASDLSVESFRDEVTRTESLLEDVYGPLSTSRPAQLFRFPYGDRGDENHEALQRILSDHDFTPPDPGQIAYDWYAETHAGARDWFWTVSVEDWAIETRAELREQVESSADRLDEPSSDIVLFHDAGNAPSQLAHFVELLQGRGVEFADPLDLVP